MSSSSSRCSSHTVVKSQEQAGSKQASKQKVGVQQPAVSSSKVQTGDATTVRTSTHKDG